jgi:hypothetical protein
VPSRRPARSLTCAIHKVYVPVAGPNSAPGSLDGNVTALSPPGTIIVPVWHRNVPDASPEASPEWGQVLGGVGRTSESRRDRTGGWCDGAGGLGAGQV